MTVVAFTMIAFLLFGAVCTIASVGKPREPITGNLAVSTLICCLAMCVGIYWLWVS